MDGCVSDLTLVRSRSKLTEQAARSETLYSQDSGKCILPQILASQVSEGPQQLARITVCLRGEPLRRESLKVGPVTPKPLLPDPTPAVHGLRDFNLKALRTALSADFE